MKSTRVSFHNERGQQLAGVLDTPLRPPSHYALFAHCFTCGKNLRTARNISLALTNAGIAVLRFDFTGLGQSEGEFEDTSFSTNVSDLVAAAAFIEEAHEAPTLLIGHSLGGTAVLQAAGKIDAARAVVTIGSPADPEHVTHLFAGSETEIVEKGTAEVSIGGRPFTIGKEFLDDLSAHDLPADVASLRKALLVLHAPGDTTVEIDQASKIFLAARHPKSFVSLDKADHLLSEDEDSEHAGRVIAAWAMKHLPRPADYEALEAEEGTVAVRTMAGGFFTEIQAGKHALVADEPKSVGGTDAGPTPYDLLAAALASCTTMTLKMYAEHKGLPLESAEVTVSHAKIHARDCADCESSAGRVDEFVREITLHGELDAAQRQRMLEIADRCPVHRTLHSEVKVRSRLRDAAPA